MRPGRFNRSNFSLKPRAKARRLFRVDHGRRHRRIAFHERRGRRPHPAAAAVRVSHHGVRDVHVDPGHPGRLGVAAADSGRPFGQFQRSVVGADFLPDRRSDRDPAFRIPVARVRHAFAVCDFRLRLHGRELLLRLCLDHRADDPVARDPGIFGRGHDPHRVRIRLHGVSAFEIPYRRSRSSAWSRRWRRRSGRRSAVSLPT